MTLLHPVVESIRRKIPAHLYRFMNVPFKFIPYDFYYRAHAPRFNKITSAASRFFAEY